MTRSEFELIAQQLRAQMLKVALDFFGNRNDAEDVAQDAMLQLWHFCEQIDVDRNVSGLAVRVAKNCCVSHYRLSLLFRFEKNQIIFGFLLTYSYLCPREQKDYDYDDISTEN